MIYQGVLVNVTVLLYKMLRIIFMSQTLKTKKTIIYWLLNQCVHA